MHTPIEHANHSLHRPPSPVRPPPDDYYYDESDPDEHDVEIESDFSKENSFSGGSKVELSGPIVSFKVGVILWLIKYRQRTESTVRGVNLLGLARFAEHIIKL